MIKINSDKEKKYLLLFSAKSRNQLLQKLDDLKHWGIEEEFQMENLSFTLAVGRSHFPVRTYVIAGDVKELLQKIEERLFLIQGDAGQKSQESDRDKLEIKAGMLVDSLQEKDGEEYNETLLALGELYRAGASLKYKKLYEGQQVHKIPLPTYPFQKTKYWLPQTKKEKKSYQTLGTLVDQNISTMEEIIFCKTLKKEEFFLKDHIVKNLYVLPGVVQLEMVTQAIAQAKPNLKVVAMEEITWLSPISLSEKETEKKVEIHFYEEEEKKVYYEITGSGKHSKQLFSEGIVQLDSDYMACSSPVIPVGKICKHNKKKKGSSIYQKLSSHELLLKESFQSIIEVYTEKENALAFLELPLHLLESFDSYTFHPTIMDGILETVIALMSGEDKKQGSVALPYSFERMECYGEIVHNCISYVQKISDGDHAEDNIFDVYLADEIGNVLLYFHRFVLKETQQNIENQADVTYFTDKWVVDEDYKKEYLLSRPKNNGILLVGEDENLCEHFSGAGTKIYQVTFGNSFGKLSEDNNASIQTYQISAQDPMDYQKLLAKLRSDHVEIKTIVISEEAMLKRNRKDETFFSFTVQLYLIQALQKEQYESVRGFWLGRQENEGEPIRTANTGFYKTIRLEQPNYIFSVVTYTKDSTCSVEEILQYESTQAKTQVRYLDSKRQFVDIEECKDLRKASIVKDNLKEKGVYCITGGMGKIGYMFATYFAKACKARLILIGRSKKTSRIEEQLKKLEKEGAAAHYYQADITDKKSLTNALETAEEKFGSIQGVLHCAGITKDSYIKDKKVFEVQKVLGPKILGLHTLYELTRGKELSFFAAFSSIAAIIGNFGQSDYAYANSYMDTFLVEKNNEHGGVYFSINWSLWEDGGMTISAPALKFSREKLGISPITEEQGIKAFEEIVGSSMGQVLAFGGHAEKFLHIVRQDYLSQKTDFSEQEKMKWKQRLMEEIVSLISGMMEIDSEKIDTEEHIEHYGFNSLTYTDLTNAINERYHVNTTPALFFQYTNIETLCDYIIEEFGAQLLKLEENRMQKPSSEDEEQKVKAPVRGRLKDRILQKEKKRITVPESEDIAIIGISGQMAEAPDMDSFWINLREQRALTKKVPIDRWDCEILNENEEKLHGRSISKYGSFLTDIDKFDYELFKINPREASLMDPQQRIFLQSVWSAIEDAGYPVSKLAGSRTGVFVGVATSDYGELLEEEKVPIESYSSTGMSHCILANRISYLFDFHGPSEPINTACSSSLVAIHRAIQSIYDGDCDMAIAGGVSLMLNPNLHISFSRSGMLAIDGTCKTFDKSANGYVRGEGVGALLLKPLSKAKADGDYIHALIKGTAVNHGGKVSSLTVPNANAQIAVLKEAYGRANILPNRVSYIEAHGTGTNLGDPVEINSLKDAFKQMYQENGLSMPKEAHCGIGAVKTNIGHLEAAAGIAGVLKVILSMKHKKLPGLVHFREQNPFIDLKGSPFYLATKTADWEYQEGQPFVAGVSSFGFGGVNAHVVLEEYKNTHLVEETKERYLFLLSAKTQIQIKTKAKMLAEYIRAHRQEGLSLADISYTLCTGREEMESRMGFTANSFEQLLQCLDDFEQNIPNAFIRSGDVLDSKEVRDREGVLDLEIEEILQSWIYGQTIDWESQRQGHGTLSFRGKRIPLPTYPFAKTTCWFSKTTDTQEQREKQVLHPMIDRNISTMQEEVFEKVLRIEDMYLRDHIVAGKVLLPGAAYVEMVRAAAEFAGISSVTGLRSVQWKRIIEMTENERAVFIAFHMQNGDDKDSRNEIAFEVYSMSEGKRIIHADGLVLTERLSAPKHINPEAVIANAERIFSKKTCYQDIFAQVGFDYGESFRITEHAYCNLNEGMSHLILPKSVAADYKKYKLHPSILDGAFRSISWVGERSEEDLTLRVPFAMERIEILAEVPQECYAYAVLKEGAEHSDSSGEKKYNIQVTDTKGNEVVRIYGFAIKELLMKETIEESTGPFYYRPCYEEKVQEVKKNDISSISPIQNSQNVLIVVGAESIEAGDWEQCMAQNEYQYKRILRFDKRTDWKQFIENEQLKTDDFVHILHMKNLNQNTLKCSGEGEYLHMEREVLEDGIYSVLEIFQAFLKKEMKVRCVFGYEVTQEQSQPLFDMVKGFLNSSQAVNPLFQLEIIRFEHVLLKESMNLLLTELSSSQFAHGGTILYENGIRKVRVLKKEQKKGTFTGFKKGGTYLITGAAGAIGKMISTYLAKEYQANLILTGRVLEQQCSEWLASLGQLGACVYYHQADIIRRDQVKDLIEMGKKRFAAINGIIHCAGIGTDELVNEVPKMDFEKILLPKVQGAFQLHEESRGEELDFFLMFSSVSSEIGDMGFCSYATANAWLDAFSKLREDMKEKGICSGRTIAVNWPLWKNSRYIVDAKNERVLEELYGLTSVTEQDGMPALDEIVKMDSGQILALFGSEMKLDTVFINTQRQADVKIVDTDSAKNKQLYPHAVRYLKKIFADTLHIDQGQIRITEPFDAYGLDSIMIMELNELLLKEFKGISKTLFYEYNTIQKLASYLVMTYGEEPLNIWNGASKKAAEINGNPVKKSAFMTQVRNGLLQEPLKEKDRHTEKADARKMDIAVIGLDGRFPMAKDVFELWRNLKEGKDCITEIPASRWDYLEDYDEQKGAKGKIYTKYGGFLDDIDKFDPMFFQMSPRDAILTDPQERLFLECAYHTMEDAGYTCRGLAKEKVGVFVGVMYGHYQIIGTQANKNGGITPPNSSFASIANRVSYLFDFKGPSLAVDTMCSSSMMALHLACESIRNKESDMALAGGVNVTIHKNKYIFLCSQRFASSEGKCRAFGDGGDGYVAGEGVGAVLLKPLEKAIADRDYIYGVIRADSSNAGGKTNGYTVPNPNAQAELIETTLEKSRIAPRTITYVEAHGTGTALGDPIEIAGLTRAFGKDSQEKQYCALGSIKSNIGHLESAAGIASLIKVLLQMKYKTLVPSIYSEPQNSNIDFTNTPFYVQKGLSPWENNAKNASFMEEGERIPRRAGISSFGAGGSNVHMIVEEYQNNDEMREENEEGEQLFLFSAKNKEQLRLVIERFANFLRNEEITNAYTPFNIAYTLQTGREALEERIAVIADSIPQLLHYLDGIQKNQMDKDSIFTGNVKKAQEVGALLLDYEDEDREYLEGLMRKKQMRKLAKLWTAGNIIYWEELYDGAWVRKVPLPGYPFKRERYWIDSPEKEAEDQQKKVLHPLIDENISTLREQKFKKMLSVEEFFLRDHVVSGQILLPGVAYLEMARVAGQIAGEQGVGSIQSVEWVRPVIMHQKEQELMATIGIRQGQVNFEIFSEIDKERVLHCRGDIVFGEPEEMQLRRLDFDTILKRCTLRKDKEYCYQTVFKTLGFDYGCSFQVTNEVWIGEGETFANLSLQEPYRSQGDQFLLHPALLDGAVRSVAVGNQKELVSQTHIPFTLKKLNIYQEIPNDCYVYTRVKEQPKQNQKGLNIFDITITDQEGNIVITIEDFIVRPYKKKTEKKASSDIYYFQENYEEKPLTRQSIESKKKVLLIGGEPSFLEALVKSWQRDGLLLESRIVSTEEMRHLDAIKWDETIETWKREHFYPDRILLLGNFDVQTPDYETYQYAKDKERWDAVRQKGINVLQQIFSSYTRIMKNQPVVCIYAYHSNRGCLTSVHSGIASFASSIVSLNKEFKVINLELMNGESKEEYSLQEDIDILTKEVMSEEAGKEIVIRYQNKERKVRTRQVENKLREHQQRIELRIGGTYLITGGAGMLGSQFAKWLAEKYQATILMTGRRSLDDSVKTLIKELQSLGGEGIYFAGNIAEEEDVEEIFQKIKEMGHIIHGVIHCAGIGGEKNILKTSPEERELIIAPKQKGTLLLDQATSGMDLDFMLFFSSVSVRLGDLGICSYGIANAFLDDFVRDRNQLVDIKKRSGKTIAIDWPLWKDGGFGLPDEQVDFYRQYLGMETITMEQGISILEHAFTSSLDVVLTAYGDQKKIEKAFKVRQDEKGQIIALLNKLKKGELSEKQTEELLGVML